MKYDTTELLVLVAEANENIVELLQRNRNIPKNKRNMADSARGVQKTTTKQITKILI